MALLPTAETDAAQSYAMVDRAVVAHHGGFTDHHAHAVIDEDAAADTGGRVNFDAGAETSDVAQPPCKAVTALNPTPVGSAVKRQRMQTGIAENHLHRTERRRVSLKNGPHVFLNALKHLLRILFLSVLVSGKGDFREPILHLVF